MILYGMEKSATDAVCSISDFGLPCELQNISRSLQLLLDFGAFVPALSSSFTLFSTVHSFPLYRSQFCTIPLDSVNFSRLFSTTVDVDDELLSLKTTRFEFSIDISDFFVWFWTCSYWFITVFSTTIRWDSSTTLCTFSDSVTCKSKQIRFVELVFRMRFSFVRSHA